MERLLLVAVVVAVVDNSDHRPTNKQTPNLSSFSCFSCCVALPKLNPSIVWSSSSCSSCCVGFLSLWNLPNPSQPLISRYCASPFSWTTFEIHYILLNRNLSFLWNSSLDLVLSSSESELKPHLEFFFLVLFLCCPGYHNTHPNLTSNLACCCVEGYHHLLLAWNQIRLSFEAPRDFYLVSVLVLNAQQQKIEMK
jgi:hypothetical protein